MLFDNLRDFNQGYLQGVGSWVLNYDIQNVWWFFIFKNV
jgi:hypothetical protein